jgi:hypothetical protein
MTPYHGSHRCGVSQISRGDCVPRRGVQGSATCLVSASPTRDAGACGSRRTPLACFKAAGGADAYAVAGPDPRADRETQTVRVRRCRWRPAAWTFVGGAVRPSAAGSCLVSCGTDKPSGTSTTFFPSAACIWRRPGRFSAETADGNIPHSRVPYAGSRTCRARFEWIPTHGQPVCLDDHRSRTHAAGRCPHPAGLGE